MIIRTVSLFAAIALLSGCTARVNPTSVFVADIRQLCGNAYQGNIVSDDAADADWMGEDIVVAVQCNRETVRMPLHVGEDRSRTWVLTREDDTLELRHDHRHEDGSEDALSQYGGFSSVASESDAARKAFPADQSTKDLFDAEGIPVSKANTWALEVSPETALLAYELRRPERFFRIEFDTSKPVDLPPPEWGADSERPNGF